MEKPLITRPRQIPLPEHLKTLESDHYALVREQGGYNPEAVEIVEAGELDIFSFDIDEVKQQLTQFLIKHCKTDANNLEAMRDSMASAVEGMMSDFSAEAAMVMVRIQMPTPDFVVPRWHRDGSFFVPVDGRKIYKKVYTPKGSPTRFAAVMDEAELIRLEKLDRNNLDRLQEMVMLEVKHKEKYKEEYKVEDIKIRQALDGIADAVSPPGKYQSVIYQIGAEDELVLHSEPDITEPRIFMAVMVGSREEIEAARVNLDSQ